MGSTKYDRLKAYAQELLTTGYDAQSYSSGRAQCRFFAAAELGIMTDSYFNNYWHRLKKDINWQEPKPRQASLNMGPLIDRLRHDVQELCKSYGLSGDSVTISINVASRRLE